MATQKEKPTTAFVLSLIGAIFILLGGLGMAVIGAAIAIFLPGLGVLLAALGLIVGIVVLIGAIMLYVNPERNATWGIIIIIFSIISFFFNIAGGFFIGMILGIIGGALGITWKPSPPVAPAAEIKRICPKCGRVIKEEVKFCPHCGEALE